VDAERASPIQMDGINATLALGAELRFAEHFVFGAGYGLTWFAPLDADDSAFDPRDRVDCVDSQFDFDRCQAARQGRARPTVAGATASPGTLAAEGLPRGGAGVAVAGRDPVRREALARRLGGDVEVRAAPVHDADALREALRGARAVVSCAGPFLRVGEPVVR